MSALTWFLLGWWCVIGIVLVDQITRDALRRRRIRRLLLKSSDRQIECWAELYAIRRGGESDGEFRELVVSIHDSRCRGVS